MCLLQKVNYSLECICYKGADLFVVLVAVALQY